MSKSYLKLGSWNAICDRCGRKFKASELKKTWDGFWVCEYDYETRHPQELLRGVKDNQYVPWTRPEGEDHFTDICSVLGRSAIAGYAEAGCSVAGLYVNPDDYNVPEGTH
jgi:hypothetical protein